MSIDLFGAPTPLTNEDVSRLTRPQREARLHDLIKGSHAILDRALESIDSEGKVVNAIVILFSGGNDSTTLAHLLKERASHAAHANTTIGIEQTREFVRETCRTWRLPLMEQKPPKIEDHYRALVLDQGFPGPAQHFKMYQRLKERSLRAIQRDFIDNPRRERIVFIAGRRRDESQRRANVPELERIGSAVWVSPLVHWTKLDLNTYRLLHDVPQNEVADLIHMSGECLCGSFATPGEREEITAWFPDVFDEIAELEALLVDRTDIPAHRKVWGWGSLPGRPRVSTSKSGPMCSTCDARQLALPDGDDSNDCPVCGATGEQYCRDNGPGRRTWPGLKHNGRPRVPSGAA